MNNWCKIVNKIIYRRVNFFSIALMFFSAGDLSAQDEDRIKLFEPKHVHLEESAFKNAQNVDLKYIMELEPDRLLYPFLREAGLEPKAKSYPNWEDTGLDGHIGGHYLTALSLMYASTGNDEVLERLNYMLRELKRAQDAYGDGYIGGVPGSRELWSEIKAGNIYAGSFSLNDRWVPLYNIHKTYAGLRDAYLLAESELAKQLLIDYTDWMMKITSGLSDEQVQELLISEHGGLNEVFADVARITGEKKYLDLAYDFSHESLLKPLRKENDVLNGMHANTQIPKVVGFEAISAISGDQDLHNAARYFWENVVNQRTVAIGGNSVREHFHPASDFSTMMSSIQGPETCNTYNMLKLSKQLFEAEGLERYIDYYEQGLYNHILSSQHPEKGGFVYFTPMRPGHYRVYSQPETSFWCCVGSGLENHGKYNELIYAYNNEDLYVNLFIPSALNWEEKNISILQETNFPKEGSTTLSVKTKKPQSLNIKIRYPSWVKAGEMSIILNGKKIDHNAVPGSYVDLKGKWKNGDKIEVELPMHLQAERLPDGSSFEALKYGPVVLAAKTGENDLQGLFADASRGGHIAEGKRISLGEMPLFVSNDTSNIASQIIRKPGKELAFSASEIIYPSEYKDLEFIPFYELHDSRYVIYLGVETPEGAKKIKEQLEQMELEELALAAMTIDEVSPGEQQPESDHFIRSEKSNIGVNQDRHWRDAEGWFSYDLRDKEREAKTLRLTYFGEDSGRNFKIVINGHVVAEEGFDEPKGDQFYEVDYEIPQEVMENSKGKLEVRIEAMPGSRTAGIYGVRLLR